MNESLGKPIDRVDGRLKVIGAATYAAEYQIKNLAYGAPVLSRITKGRVKFIDIDGAKKMPGVIGVMTSENCMMLHSPSGSDPGSGKFAEKDLLPLQNDRVLYGGQYIAVVVAETAEKAEQAAATMKVTYEEQEPAVGFEANFATAYQPGSGLGGAKTQEKRGDADAAMLTAAITSNETYRTPVYSHNGNPTPLLLTGMAIKLTVYDATQSVMGVQGLLSTILGIPKENTQVYALYIGGGFGSKGFTWANTLLAPMAAKQFDRPVKIELKRQQVFSAAGRRTQTQQKIGLGAGPDGKLTSIKHDTISETSFVDEFVETAGVATSMIYSSPNV